MNFTLQQACVFCFDKIIMKTQRCQLRMSLGRETLKRHTQQLASKHHAPYPTVNLGRNGGPNSAYRGPTTGAVEGNQMVFIDLPIYRQPARSLEIPERLSGNRFPNYW